jgi:hypothetical protein
MVSMTDPAKVKEVVERLEPRRVFNPCPVCDGAGEWDEGPINCGGPAPVDPIYRQVFCGECNGTGCVEEDAALIDEDDLDEMEMGNAG